MNQTNVVAQLLSIVAIVSLQYAVALKFTSVQMPALVQRGTNFWLACQYELAPNQQLYSVKWYKNNEEFYRLLLNQPQQSIHTSGYSDVVGVPDKQQHQQYFSQAGVNVLMSASNATHVRLLNASLESDGSYACEISTENLSTIRHEKEIKVYVLPHLKLNVIGLKSLYSPGDFVELQCLSDFSRPAGTLAWFINNRRITTNLRSFRLELKKLQSTQTSTTSVADSSLASQQHQQQQQQQLERSNLMLKFKLTNEILVEFGASSSRDQGDQLTGFQRRNQSLGLSSSSLAHSSWPVGLTPPWPSGKLLELFHLECRYKLTDVSDVTFNELKVARNGAGHNRRSASQRYKRQLSTVDSKDAGHLPLSAPQPRRARTVQGSGQLNRVIQWPAWQTATDRLEWRKQVSTRHHLNAANDSCQSGRFGLQLEDPIILSSQTDELGQGENELHSESEFNPNDLLEFNEGATLNLNCTTLAALLADGQSKEKVARGNLGQSWQDSADTEHRQKFDRELSSDSGGADKANLCTDQASRRRALISGKYQTQLWPLLINTATIDEEQMPQQRRKTSAYQTAPKSRKQQQQQPQSQLQHQIAYVTTSLLSVGGDRQQGANDAESSAARGSLQTMMVTKSLAQLEQHHHRHNQQQQQQQQQLFAPPLLEWFINNQEAPKSSASYSPELPLTLTPGVNLISAPTSASSSVTKPNQLDIESLDGTTNGEHSSSSGLPSIDYGEYFANFPSRPIEQHLKLSLKLDKKHFLTSDSMLTLRCSSTQALVLTTDSVHVSFLLAPSVNSTSNKNDESAGKGYSGLSHQQSDSLNWNQRSSSNNNQIKQKYLHQYPRSSSQKFSSPGNNHHDSRERINQSASKNNAARLINSPSIIFVAASTMTLTTLFIMIITIIQD